MRIPPKHIVKAIRDYDPELGIGWCQRDHVWYFTWREKRAFVYKHEDGVVARDLVSVDEVLRVIGASDNHRRGARVRLAAMERQRAEREYLDELDRRQRFEAIREERDDRTRVWEKGARPFLPPATAKTA